MAALVCAALAGCGGGGGDAGAPPAVPDEVVGVAPPAIGSVPSVITLVPASGATAPPPAVDPVEVDQLSMAFSPSAVVSPVGRPVVFRNSEVISHNVTVRSQATGEILLDVDLDTDATADLVLDTPGGYDVSCGVHPGMSAFIYVTSAGYVALADVDGAFAVPDVPPGTYTLSVWSRDPGERSERTVEVGRGRTDVGSGS